MAAVAAPKICKERERERKGRKGKKQRREERRRKRERRKGKKGRGEQEGKMCCGCKTPLRIRAVASLTVPDGQDFHFPHFSSNFDQIFLFSRSNFAYFLPHFGPPGGRFAHPGRPWLRHCSELLKNCKRRGKGGRKKLDGKCKKRQKWLEKIQWQKTDWDVKNIIAQWEYRICIGLLRLKSIHPLWKILEKCLTEGVWIFKYTFLLCNF